MSEKKSTKIFWDWWTFVEALLLIASGVMAIFWSDNDWMQSLAIILAASFILADAVSRFAFMLVQYSKDKKDQESVILISGLEITVGTVIIIFRTNILAVILWTLTTILLALGGLLLIYALVLLIRRLHTKIWLAAVEIVGGAIAVALGVVILVKFQFQKDQAFATMVVGIIIALIGLIIAISALVDIFRDSSRAKKEKKAKESESHEVAKSSTEVVPEAEPVKKEDNTVIDVETVDATEVKPEGESKEEPKQIEGGKPKKLGWFHRNK